MCIKPMENKITKKKATKKKITLIISLIFLVAGLFFLVNSQANITGAVIGVSTSPSAQGYFFGATLILISFILFTLNTSAKKEKKQENNPTEK